MKLLVMRPSSSARFARQRTIPAATWPLIVLKNGRRMEKADKQKRITLKTVHKMLDGMSVELAEKVHLLFMANYIDYSDYDFRDENQVEGYCWCYRDLFELKTKASQEIVNSQVIEFLDEWRQDAPSRYRRAKDDICYWMADEMDINLEVFNLETDFFGDLHCSSPFTDMLCDAQAQYEDYSELDECPMWAMWQKDGGG